MDQSVDDAEFVAAEIAGLRERLIDLSKRNRMLNFKHSERSRSQIRIVDGNLVRLYEKLVTAGTVTPFLPLPPMRQEPEDERTTEFRSAVEAARRADAEYAVRLKGLDGSVANDPRRRKLERWLRDRVRASRGMDPAAATKPGDIREHTREHGIDPGHELTSRAPAKDGLQTLLFADPMSAKLRKLLSLVKLAEQETGAATLFAAFGFLQWQEDEAAPAQPSRRCCSTRSASVSSAMAGASATSWKPPGAKRHRSTCR